MLLTIKNFVFDSDRKNFSEIFNDLSFLKKKKFSTRSYFTSLMYKKSSGNIRNYIDDKVNARIRYKYYRANGKHPILENKVAFQEHLQANGIPGTNYLAKLERGVLTIGDKSFIARDRIKSEIENLANSYESIFIKPTDGAGGKGIVKIDNGEELDTKDLSAKRNYIIEQTLKQHEAVSKISPHSINTLRVISVRDGEEIVIPNCIFRMSIGESYVDNASSGGIFIAYDIDTDRLGDMSYQFFQYGAKSFFKHPMTNFVFKDAPLPFNKEVKELIKKAAESFKKIDLIGWDVAFTEDGPVLIEGNDKPHVVGMQITSHGLLSKEVYKKLFEKYL